MSLIYHIKNIYLYMVECFYGTNHVDQIIPGIWLGDVFSSQNISFLKLNNIKCIINCSLNIPFCNEFEGETYHINIDDNIKETDKYQKIIDKYVDIIEKFNKNNENVLIHCQAGRQRSATLVAEYLKKYKNYNPEKAIKLINTQRPLAFWPHITFEKIII